MVTDKQLKEGFKKLTKTLSELESGAHRKNPFAGTFRDGILKAVEDLGLMEEYNKFRKSESR